MRSITHAPLGDEEDAVRLVDNAPPLVSPYSQPREHKHEHKRKACSYDNLMQVEELETHRDEGLRLAKLANQQPLTLLYAAKDTQQNHALVLAEWLKSLI